MTRLINEVTQEVQALGWTFADEDSHVAARALGERLADDERIEIAVPGVRFWFEDTYTAWLIVTYKRAILLTIKGGGWFSKPSLHDLSDLPFSSILEVGLRFDSRNNAISGSSGNQITL